jgi:hypothetical protein
MDARSARPAVVESPRSPTGDVHVEAGRRAVGVLADAQGMPNQQTDTDTRRPVGPARARVSAIDISAGEDD